jgi:hypothetical protein
MDHDAYDVYATVLANARAAHQVPPALMLVQLTTQSWDSPECFREPLKGEWQEVLNDYRRQNMDEWTLQAHLLRPYKLAPKEEVRKGWALYDRKYPGSGFYFVSAVGFNKSKTRAMVFMGYACGGRCGSGSVHFFVKADGRWNSDRSMSACGLIS